MTEQPPTEPRLTRVEREVLEILEKSDRPPSSTEKLRAEAERIRVVAPAKIEQQTKSRVRNWRKLIGWPLIIGLAVAGVIINRWSHNLSLLLVALSIGILLAMIFFPQYTGGASNAGMPGLGGGTDWSRRLRKPGGKDKL